MTHVGGRGYHEAYESARARRSRQEPGVALPEEALEPYYCDALGITPLEFYQLTREQLLYHLAWREGKGLAEWAAAHPPAKGGSGGG